MLSAIIYISFIAFLAVLGGGTGGGGGSDFTLNDARVLSHALVEEAEPSRAPVSARFDGTDVEVTIRRAGGAVSLRSDSHAVRETLPRFPLSPSPVAGHRFRDWTLYRDSDQEASAAHVTVSWDHSDPTDYLAGGYWMHLPKGHGGESLDSAEIGAFVVGPELSGTPAMPELGTATYRGHASGLYTFYYGPGWQHLPFPEGFEVPVDGTREAGVYTGVVSLTADFAANTLSGCIGCMLPGANPNMIILETAGDTIAPDGTRGELTAIYLNTPGRSFARIHLGEAPIRPDGTFAGADLTFEIDYFPAHTGSTSQGTWDGRFSTIQDPAGDPRLVGGTTNAQWSNPLGGRSVFVGNFVAGKRPGNSGN